jgi:hypothetical protein
VGLRRAVLEQAHITGKSTAKARKATLNSFLFYPLRAFFAFAVLLSYRQVITSQIVGQV